MPGWHGPVAWTPAHCCGMRFGVRAMLPAAPLRGTAAQCSPRGVLHRHHPLPPISTDIGTLLGGRIASSIRNSTDEALGSLQSLLRGDVPVTPRECGGTGGTWGLRAGLGAHTELWERPLGRGVPAHPQSGWKAGALGCISGCPLLPPQQWRCWRPPLAPSTAPAGAWRSCRAPTMGSWARCGHALRAPCSAAGSPAALSHPIVWPLGPTTAR